MTVETDNSRVTYAGDDVSTVFAIPFYFINDEDVAAVIKDASGDGVPQTLNVDYTLTGAGVLAGGTLTMLTAPASGEFLSITSDPPITQLSSFVPNQPFPSEAVENGFDRLTQIAQRTRDKVNRGMWAPDSDVDPNVNLPVASERAGKYPVFDANGDLEMATALPSGTLTSSSIATTLDSLKRTAAEIAAGVTPTNYAYAPGWTERYGGGSSASGSTNKTALQNAIAGNDDISVGPGTYDYLTISSSDKRITFREGVTIKLPNGTVDGADVTGPAVLGISGNNVSLYGDFTIDGNSANNDGSGIDNAVIIGALHVSGDDCHINGKVTVTDAYWRGFTVQNGNDTGDEVEGFQARCIRIENPANYAALLWTAKKFHIDRIEVERGDFLDARVRIGTQNSSTGQCRDGHIGAVQSDSSVVLESGAYKVSVGKINCAVFKYQECTDCDVVAVYSDYGSSYSQDDIDSFGVGVVSVERCYIGAVNVVNYNCTTQKAVSIGGCVDSYIGSISVSDSVAALADCYIRSVDGLRIGAIFLKGTLSSGFAFDTDTPGGTYQPQRRLTIGSLIAKGYTTDVTLDSSNSSKVEQIVIGYINPDAVIATGGGSQPMGTFVWGVGTASKAVDNGFVTADSIVEIIPKDANAGVVVKTLGYYVTCASGTFTAHTGDGTNTAGDSNWNYVIKSSWTPTA